MAGGAVGFLSYARFDDNYENGRITLLRERLSFEVELQTGAPFRIFQDRADIGWGQSWRERLEQSLDEATFLFPILSPGFFRSEHCRGELARFVERERQLGRNDLILPVYYVACQQLDQEERRREDELAELLHQRQRMDWRTLRHEPFTSPEVGKAIERLARQIVDALDRVGDVPRPAQREPRRSSRVATSAGDSAPDKPAEQGSVPAAIQDPTPLGRNAAPNEPPTHVVDPLHRGDFTTITRAIESAQPGDRILVRPGLYREGLVVDKPLELIGEGEPGDVVVEATGCHVILFKTTMGRVTNLTLRQLGGGNWYGVDIAQGRLELEACDITSQSLSVVAIHDGADPRLRRNRIHDGKQGGICVYDNGAGVIEDNEIFANALSGLEIRTGGNPTVRRNTISKNG